MESQIDWDLLFKTVIAMALASVIGFERELRKKPAGLRTHMFVGGAAALLVVLSELIVGRFAELMPNATQADPIRVFEVIVVGVSFIGAGTIVQREQADRIEGLTTAASLLMVAAIGIAVALDQALLAAVVTAVVVVVAVVLRLFEREALGNDKD